MSSSVSLPHCSFTLPVSCFQFPSTRSQFSVVAPCCQVGGLDGDVPHSCAVADRCIRTSRSLSLADSGRGGSLGNYSCSTPRPASDGHHLTHAEHHPSLSPQPGCRNLQAAAHVCPETPLSVHIRGASFAELKDGQRELQDCGRAHQRLCGRPT